MLAIDVRSLAALRIALGLTLVVDLAIRSTALIAHYTDVGVLPRPARISIYEFRGDSSARYWWSLHMAGGTGWFEFALFLVATGFAVWLILGYRTRLATLASWILLVSLQSRLPGVNQGGDILLRMLLFWSLFLPLGACWSIDRQRASPECGVVPQRVFSMATIAILLQVVLMYWCAAYAKLDPVWTREGSAVYYALHFDMYAKPLGIYLRQFPRVCQMLTFATLGLEWLGPLLPFIPWRNWLWRTIAVALFWSFHFGLALTMELGLFSYVSMIAWLPFLPTEFWDAAGRQSARLTHWLSQRARLRQLDEPSRRILRHSAAPYFKLSLAGNLLVACLLALVTYVNVAGVSYPQGAIPGPPALHAAIAVLRLEQQWLLFAPRPSRADGWCVMRGVLEDGSEVNLWQPDQPLTTARPASIRAQSPNHRWRKYLAHLCWDADREQLSCFSDWLRWRWEIFHSQGKPHRNVRSVEIVFHLEETPPPGQPAIPVKPILIWDWDYLAAEAGAPPLPAEPPIIPEPPARAH